MTQPFDEYPLVVAPIRQWRGDPLTVTLGPLTYAGSAVSLASYGTSFTAQLRAAMDTTDYTPFAVSTVVGPDMVTPQKILLTLTSAQTAAVNRGTYGFDVQASGGSITPFTIFTGAVIFDGDWTR